jgi:putative transposase
MARLPRLSLAGYAHYVIQRGKQSLFYTDDDRKAYLAWLAQYCRQFNVALHAYVLLDTQTHLVLTPQTSDAVPKLMQSLSRRYAQYLNQFHKRSGTLWDGRYKSTLIDADNYLMTLLTYLHQQAESGHSSWSSHAHYSGERIDPLVTTHPIVWTLGNTPFAREKAYKDLIAQGISNAHDRAISNASLKGWALGDTTFLEQLQLLTDRPVVKRKSGRPIKI